MFKKMCTCGAIINQGRSRCRKCQVGVDRDRAKYQARYDKGRPEHHSVYHTTTWKKIRKVALVRDNYLCKECMKARGVVVQATTVHHIDPLEEDRSKAYDINNLISLCNSCHETIHNSYERSKQDKVLTQERLTKYIK